MAPIDFARARAFVAAVPAWRWTAYKDVAEAGGNIRGAQAVGDWLRREGHRVPNVYRVLNVEGQVPDGFKPAGPGVPADDTTVRQILRQEGVKIDARGRASARQQFTVVDWKSN